MSANNKNFFKAIYMFVVLFLLDVALVYSLVQLGNGSYRKIDAIVCFGAINAVFIYLNFGEIKVIYVNDTLRMYKNDDIRMYNFDCITDTIVEVITTCNTYTLLTVHLL